MRARPEPDEVVDLRMRGDHAGEVAVDRFVKKEISFRPAVSAQDFSCFFSTGGAWGIYRQKIDPRTKRRTSGR